MKIFKKNIKWFLLFFALLLFISILEDVLDKDIYKFDSNIYLFLKKYLSSDILISIFKAITNLGGTIFLVGLTIIIFLLIKSKKIGLLIVINLPIAALLNFLIKLIISRPRPEINHLVNVSGYSFPSGHSMVSLSFYGFLMYIIYKKVKNKKVKTISMILLSILIVLIGISRIILGVHFPSDVIAGYLIGISYLIVYTNIIKNYKLMQ